jgi:hypothetical protein
MEGNMITSADLNRISERMMGLDPETLTPELEALEDEIHTLEESGFDLEGFDPLAFDADPFANENIPEGK